MFGNHHDETNDNQPGAPQAPGTQSVVGPDPSAPPPPPPGFGAQLPDPALDDLAAAPEPEEASPEPPVSEDSPSPASEPDDDLLDIKQDALKKLEPLVGELDQSPEEKFKTTMMLIQATDDKTKIKDAYAAAQDIKDEKERAQALLDVVNEINYFSQKEEA